LEAVVILAALMASLVGANRAFRRPMAAGVLLALAATAVTWWLAQKVLTTFSHYGERLEAVVSLVAIGVLLLITNWFFHQVYWKDHLANFHARKKALMGSVAAGQVLGFVLLGFSSVYREGFETVLFLQALVLESGLWTVLQGVMVGTMAVLAVGFMTFKLQSRLPYKRMLVWTGVLIGAVLLVMVGNTVHALQVVGWLPTHPIRWLSLPYWAGLWFGTFPTWEGIALQLTAAVFVIGSYYLAEHQRSRRRTVGRPVASKAAGPRLQEEMVSTRSGIGGHPLPERQRLSSMTGRKR
jgi:high-affinity iron transporter